MNPAEHERSEKGPNETLGSNYLIFYNNVNKFTSIKV